MEVFLEATPTAFVFMILIVSTITNINSRAIHVDDEGLSLLVLGSRNGTFKAHTQIALFLVSCASSIFSSAFGVTR